MRILIIGTGVIGSVVGWQLSGRNELTHFVRPQKRRLLEEEGIRIECDDQRRGGGLSSATYRPRFIDDLGNAGSYDLRIIAVKSNQLLPFLAERGEAFRSAQAMVMQNVGMGDYAEVLRANGRDTSFVYPFMMGGGRSEGGIRCAIFGQAINNMVIGNPTGKRKAEEEAIRRELEAARLRPVISRRIVPYLKLHNAWATCCVAAYAESGSYEGFSSLPAIAKSYRAMRECFAAIGEEEGMSPRLMMPYSLYYLPLPFLAAYTRKLYRTEAMRSMFEGHISSSPDEMRAMYEEMMDYCASRGARTPVFAGYESRVRGA